MAWLTVLINVISRSRFSACTRAQPNVCMMTDTTATRLTIITYAQNPNWLLSSAPKTENGIGTSSSASIPRRLRLTYRRNVSPRK